MGRWLVQTSYDLQGWLPHQPSKVQIRTATVPPQRVSFGNGVLVSLGRGERLASSDNHQTDFARNSRSSQRTKHQGSCTGWGIHYLLVSMGCNLIRSFLGRKLFWICSETSQGWFFVAVCLFVVVMWRLQCKLCMHRFRFEVACMLLLHIQCLWNFFSETFDILFISKIC